MTDGQEDAPAVPIHCPECGTKTDIPLSEVADRLDRHNEQLHDGEAVAEVDPELADQLADVVAEDLGLL